MLQVLAARLAFVMISYNLFVNYHHKIIMKKFSSTTNFAVLSGLLLISINAHSRAADAPLHLMIQADKPGVAVSPMQHGVFFEDINYGADGGLYAELVQNRSFEHKDNLYAWTKVGNGKVDISTENAMNANNPHYLRLNATGAGFGIANSGFGGVPVKAGEKYRFAVRARAGANYRGALRATLQDESGKTLGEIRLPKLNAQWRELKGVLTSNATSANARLVVMTTTAGQVDLDVVSLFPQNTYKQRPNGLRADMVKMLADMKTGFVRFPGGCIVEGRDLENAYRWKETIGDIATRKQNWNRWQEWNAPHYYQSYGLGFFEYFQLCEDIGAEAVPIVNVGMACQFQSGQLVPMDELGPWVQDALDLVEFANGPATSTWGAKRAAMGHPAPFNMKYLGVGNEQWGEEYFKRYKVFYDALKAKYPEITLVTTSGPGVDDDNWKLAWNKFAQGTPAQIVDEHYYRSPQWFLENSERYDSYNRNGPKVFAGEFAAHDADKENTLRAALAEAAFMTGLERNADVVKMASYAPLFAKIGSTQWTPDLIWLDNTRIYGSPSFHVQAMYGRNRPDVTLPVALEGAANTSQFAGRVGLSTWNTQAEFKDIQVTKNGQALFSSDFAQGLNGWDAKRGSWKIVDGALRQSEEIADTRILVGDASWSDYTFSLKARKVSGKEGFLIVFQAAPDGSASVWNLGGWNNTQHGLDVSGAEPQRIAGSIETGRWYDVRVEVQGAQIKCYLDGKLVQQATRKALPALYATAGVDKRSGDTILKVVNPFAQSALTTIDLRGVKAVANVAQVSVLTGKNPSAVNTLQNPRNIAPREGKINVPAPEFQYNFPANSFTILRLKTLE